jgi:hypothetical protein
MQHQAPDQVAFRRVDLPIEDPDAVAPGPLEPLTLEEDEALDLEAQDLSQIDDADPDPEPVSYTGTDFDVEGLVRRLARHDIAIPTFGRADESVETAGFQREFVWRRPQMDRFIESLLLGYPIPGIFLVQQADKRYLVLDGHQRLRTLADFYGGLHRRKEFALENVGERYQGLTYAKLSPEQKRQLDNTFIQATIVRTDGTPESLDAVYQVFERLNSGGTQLTAHEIRVALYAGPFIDFLAKLNALSDWRALYGRESPRLRDQELVLRIVALYVSPGTYRRPLKKYLNDFAALHRSLKDLRTDTIRERFQTCAHLLANGPGPSALRVGEGQVNAALTEALFVGLFRRLDAGSSPDLVAVGEALAGIHKDEGFTRAISRATADEESVRTRLAVATQAFATT